MILPQRQLIGNATAKKRIREFGQMLSRFGRSANDVPGLPAALLADAVAFRQNRAGDQTDCPIDAGVDCEINPTVISKCLSFACFCSFTCCFV
jgi:hypothetical protein